MGEAGVLAMQPIGRVVQSRAWSEQASTDATGQELEPGHQEGWAEIEIDADWTEALDGIEVFSHIWVVWWLDRFEAPPTSHRIHPEGVLVTLWPRFSRAFNNVLLDVSSSRCNLV